MNASNSNLNSNSRKRQRTKTASRIKAPAGARDLGQGASPEANRRAAVILEVLAGERSPPQAAIALSVSLPYFYLLERKALQGLLQACEAQPKGPPGPTPERQLALARAELARCQRECQRQAALVRATQRAVGLPALPPVESRKGPDKAGRRRRNRRPTARALRAAETLRKNSAGLESAPTVEREANAQVPHGSPSPLAVEKELQHVG